MHLTSERRLDGDLLEQDFTLDGVPGILWTPAEAAGPTPLILLGHPGGTASMYPRLLGRARSAAALGFSSATLELPGSGNRPRIPDIDAARIDLQKAVRAGEPVTASIVDRLVLPLLDQAIPELQAAIDALLALPGISGPVGYSGGVIAIGVRLAAVDPRIVAAGLFAGSFIPGATYDDARRLTIPIHVLLQWDDEFNDRQAALDLFDAFGSGEKTLQANLGGHRGVPAYAGADAARFFERHLR
ncbi:alpha/beta hydrolase [Gordonia sp. PP30]|uniref:dienelactone hydrolase family protein n=1 Tax=Gordonia sp. PP30 TaxID=2935861 RepID=UPI001FFF9AE6|nr:alpha/beta hydrolase [Gordonia sp. PP30]UQE76577.1 alpha/beta hydrolase [Gordonia sp. PP30]